MPVSDFVSLCLIWTRINFPTLSHRGCLLSLSLRIVCSEHRGPRGMGSSLAIIKMSYSWADRQENSTVTFMFEKQAPVWGRGVLHSFMGLKFCLFLEKSLWGCNERFISSAHVAAPSTSSSIFTEAECKWSEEVLFCVASGRRAKCIKVLNHLFIYPVSD